LAIVYSFGLNPNSSSRLPLTDVRPPGPFFDDSRNTMRAFSSLAAIAQPARNP